MDHSLSPEQRSLRARLASHTSWANTADRAARTAAGRKAAMDRFDRLVDPDGVMPPQERAKRAANARKAHFTRMALLSAKARQARCNAAAQVSQPTSISGESSNDHKPSVTDGAARAVAAVELPQPPHRRGRAR